MFKELLRGLAKAKAIGKPDFLGRLGGVVREQAKREWEADPLVRGWRTLMARPAAPVVTPMEEAPEEIIPTPVRRPILPIRQELPIPEEFGLLRERFGARQRLDNRGIRAFLRKGGLR